MAKNFEYVIRHIGGFGRFQITMVIAVFGQKFFSSWSMMQMAFAGIVPDFDCLTDGIYFNHSRTGFHGNPVNLTDSLNQCSLNGSSCSDFKFDNSIRTIVNEWDLVCDLSWVKATTTSVQMAGVLVGSLVAGQSGDMFGRRRTCFGFYLGHSLLNVLIVFSNSWQMFMAFRFLIGVGIGAILVMCLPYPTEFVPEDRRAAIPVIPMWSLGVCFFALLAYLMEDWVHLHLAIAGISAVLWLGWFFVPESIRWLTVQGRTQDAYQVFERIAAVNGKTLPDDTMKVIEIVAEEEKKLRESGAKYSYKDIFRGPGMVKNTLSFGFMWVALSLVFYGIGFGVSGLGGNVYFNLFLLNIIDIPAAGSTFWLSNRFGRGKTCALLFFIGAVAAFGVMVIELAGLESGKTETVIVLNLVAKSSIAAAWVASQSWIIETYPTVTRNLGYGFANMTARVGGIIAPLAIDLDERLVLSYSLMGGFMLVSAILCFVCEETMGVALPDSIVVDGRKAKGGDYQAMGSDVMTTLEKGEKNSAMDFIKTDDKGENYTGKGSNGSVLDVKGDKNDYSFGVSTKGDNQRVKTNGLVDVNATGNQLHNVTFIEPEKTDE